MTNYFHVLQIKNWQEILNQEPFDFLCFTNIRQKVFKSICIVDRDSQKAVLGKELEFNSKFRNAFLNSWNWNPECIPTLKIRNWNWNAFQFFKKELELELKSNEFHQAKVFVHFLPSIRFIFDWVWFPMKKHV